MSSRSRIKTVLVTLGAATVILGSSYASVANSRDFDCSDFRTHKQAQKFFKHHHPKADPYNLDADNDGIACEDLP